MLRGMAVDSLDYMFAFDTQAYQANKNIQDMSVNRLAFYQKLSINWTVVESV